MEVRGEKCIVWKRFLLCLLKCFLINLFDREILDYCAKLDQLGKLFSMSHFVDCNKSITESLDAYNKFSALVVRNAEGVTKIYWAFAANP
ncbi:hypothetical protein KR99_24120 [Ralstonia solanacearum]|nr:hypothetical protein KR99_24120 [Ralstonia solanacearum]